jgi:hypothetical protein
LKLLFPVQSYTIFSLCQEKNEKKSEELGKEALRANLTAG